MSAALVLPTTPTWGIAVWADPDEDPYTIDEWGRRTDRLRPESEYVFGTYSGWGIDSNNILDFIPLTDEQVARIEAAR